MTKTIIILVLCSLLLVFTGFLTYDVLIQLIKPVNNNFQLVQTSLSQNFRHRLYFSLFWGIIPIALYLFWRFAKINLLKNKIITSLIILTGIFLALIFRIFSIQAAANFKISDQIVNQISFENIKFERFMIGGLLLGMIICLAIFRQKKANT